MSEQRLPRMARATPGGPAPPETITGNVAQTCRSDGSGLQVLIGAASWPPKAIRIGGCLPGRMVVASFRRSDGLNAVSGVVDRPTAQTHLTLPAEAVRKKTMMRSRPTVPVPRFGYSPDPGLAIRESGPVGRHHGIGWPATCWVTGLRNRTRSLRM